MFTESAKGGAPGGGLVQNLLGLRWVPGPRPALWTPVLVGLGVKSWVLVP